MITPEQPLHEKRTLVPRPLEEVLSPAEECRLLLRRRLLGIAIVCGLTFLQVFHVLLWNRVEHDGPTRLGLLGATLLSVNVVLCLGTITLVLAWPTLGLAGLRALRTMLLLLVATFLAAWHYSLLTFAPTAGFPNVADHHTYVLFAQFHGLLTWVILIVVIGFFVAEEPLRTRWEMGLVWGLIVSLVLLAVVLNPILRSDAAGLLLTAFGIPGTAVVLAELAGREARGWRFEARHARRQIDDLRHYQLTKKLGEGGVAEVWLAEHQLLHRPCAVKILRPGSVRDPSFPARMEREVQATAQLAHPNIIEVYDCGTADDGSYYYVMEYLPGMDLEHLVGCAGPLPAGRAVSFLRQICGALRAAHHAGLVHRDVKPSNVMICGAPGRCDLAKLLDFGLVRSLNNSPLNHLNLTLPGTAIGTPEYMSPEQAVGVTEIDIRADLYALGGLAYFMLTGRPPFVRETPLAALTAHAYEAPEPPSRLRSEVPFDLEVIVMKCLAKSPNDRFDSAADLERALAKCRCAAEWTSIDSELWWEKSDKACCSSQELAPLNSAPRS